MNFKNAVREAPSPVDKAYCRGKQGLKKEHRKLVTCSETRRITGSIDLDSALAGESRFANDTRWDYGLGYVAIDRREQAIWVEVHSATTGEVSKVLRKLQWLRDWLAEHAEHLNQLTLLAKGDIRFVWVASGGSVRITANSKEARQLSTKGISVKKYLELP